MAHPHQQTFTVLASGLEQTAVAVVVHPLCQFGKLFRTLRFAILLIDGCKRGEASARKELYELYAPAMMSVCARYVHDRETARDLLQDGFIKVFTKIQTYLAPGYEGYL